MAEKKTERIVVSEGKNGKYRGMVEVVYRSVVGKKKNGKPKYATFTKHEKK